MKPFNKKFNFFLLIIFAMSLLLFTALSCDTTEPKENMQVQLTALDASCTEAWLKLSASAPVNPTVKITTGDRIVFEGILTTSDTMIYVDSLSPSTDYTYKAELTANTNKVTTSTTIRTMDTTSHNFAWQTFTFGEHSSSALYDVAIIDENNIWAVGQIYLYDSTGTVDPHAYNAVHWDGNKWNLIRIYYRENSSEYLRPIRSVFAFTDKDIWFGNFTHWDGEKFDSLPLNIEFNSTINKIWGTNSDDLYAVGNGGNIAHYNGKEWKKISSGTELDIYDIWGIINNNEGVNIYCAADKKLLLIDERNNVSEIQTELALNLLSVWGITNRKVYAAGNGLYLYRNNNFGKSGSKLAEFIYAVRGINHNEVYGLSGQGNTLMFFNGRNWRQIETQTNNRFFKLTAHKRVIAACGFNGQAATITLFNKN